MARKKQEDQREPLTIKMSTDYDKFVMHDVRDVTENRLKRLLDEVAESDLLHHFPIIVRKARGGKKLHVVDGNLRLLTAQELQRPIYYVEGADVTAVDIGRALGFMSKWTLMEYLYYWTAEDSEAHHQVLLFMGKHGAPTPVTAVQLLTGNVRRNVGVETNCRRGVLEITHAAWAEEVCTCVEEILEHADDLKPTQSLFQAFAILYANPFFSLRRWRSKVAVQASLLTVQRTMGEYFHMLRQAYNAGRSAPDQIPPDDFLRRDLVPITRQGAQPRVVRN